MKHVKFENVRIFPKKIVYDQIDITFNHLMSICPTNVIDVIWAAIRFQLTSIVKHDIKDIIMNELNNEF